MPGSAQAEIEFTPALLSTDTSVPAQKWAIRMAVRNQRANCPATSQYIVADMFIMRTMVDERRNQINMPRLDAYRLPSHLLGELAASPVTSSGRSERHR